MANGPEVFLERGHSLGFPSRMSDGLRAVNGRRSSIFVKSPTLHPYN